MYYIYKPSWLESWLSRLNWDILTWHIYVGDAIESAIDWALNYINIALEWGENAWDLATATWARLLQEASSLWQEINNLWDIIYQAAQDVWSTITSWWQDISTVVLSWIDERIEAAKSWLLSIIDSVENWAVSTFLPLSKWLDIPELIWSWMVEHLGKGFISIWNEVIDFFTSTIPKTWQSFIDALNDWAKEQEWISVRGVIDRIQAALAPYQEFIDRWTKVQYDIGKFLSFPLTWLIEKIDWLKFWDEAIENLEAVGGTEEQRDEIYKGFPTVEKQIAEAEAVFKDEKLITASPEWGMIEEELGKIRAVLATEIGV